MFQIRDKQQQFEQAEGRQETSLFHVRESNLKKEEVKLIVSLFKMHKTKFLNVSVQLMIYFVRANLKAFNQKHLL